jgi:hypothetical protein
MHKGPYRVAGREGLEYKLENLISKEYITKPIFLVRPYHYDASRTNPADIALLDHSDEFYVEAILNHTGRFSRKDQMTFTVQWEGYDETYNTSEPWNGLKNNAVFREYINNLGYAKLLPINED